MAHEKSGGDPATKLDTVQALLRTAGALLDEVSAPADPLAARWEAVFARMPATDRKAILQIVEREVEMRLLEGSSRADSLTGFSIVRANPNARLYVRVFGPQPTYQNQDDIMRATLRAARLFLLTPREFHADWKEATLEAFRALEPAEREALREHNREMLALLDRTASEPKKAS